MRVVRRSLPPDAVRRTLSTGGVSRGELLARVRAAGVSLNELAHRLFDDPRFVPAAAPSRVDTVEISVGMLGLPGGGTIAAVLDRAREAGLAPCPLEVGPHLRLLLVDQPEGAIGHPSSTHRAPPGSLTVLSEPLDDDPNAPRGFYLRRIDGTLWLRGFRAGPEHVYDPADRVILREIGDGPPGDGGR